MILRWLISPFAAALGLGLAFMATCVAVIAVAAVVGIPLGMPHEDFRLRVAPYALLVSVTSALIAWTWIGSRVAPRLHRRLAFHLFSVPVVLLTVWVVVKFLSGHEGLPREAALAIAAGSLLSCAGLLVIGLLGNSPRAKRPDPSPGDGRTAVRIVSASQRLQPIPATPARSRYASIALAACVLVGLVTVAALNYRALHTLGSYPLARFGNTAAQNDMGAAYSYGWGVKKDDATALEWFLAAANQGDKTAQFNVGVTYEQGKGVPVNLETAAVYYRLSAEHGYAGAQNNLAMMYRNGAGVEQDYEAALDWLRRAANQGHATAQYNLGSMYEEGLGVTRNSTDAEAWYSKAAAQGLPQARLKLPAKYPLSASDSASLNRSRNEMVVMKAAKAAGTISESDDELLAIYLGNRLELPEAIRKYRERASRGDVDAQFNLASVYATGRNVPKDPAESIRWFRLAAEQGHAKAQLRLGFIYVQGFGVKKDVAQAATWFRLAADRGNASAQYNLGVMYQKGVAVPRDLVQAYKWYSIAAGRVTPEDDPDLSISVARNRAIAVVGLQPAQLAEAERLAQEWRPTETPRLRADGN
jgi:TPR repeat protein